MIKLTSTRTKSMINENYEIRTEINEIEFRLEAILDREHVDAVTMNIIQKDIDKMENKIRKNNLIMSTIVTEWDS